MYLGCPLINAMNDAGATATFPTSFTYAPNVYFTFFGNFYNPDHLDSSAGCHMKIRIDTVTNQKINYLSKVPSVDGNIMTESGRIIEFLAIGE